MPHAEPRSTIHYSVFPRESLWVNSAAKMLRFSTVKLASSDLHSTQPAPRRPWISSRAQPIDRWRRWCVPSCVPSSFVSAFVCSFRGLFACVLSWVEICITSWGTCPDSRTACPDLSQ
jgi:hypothetical protein